MQLDLGFEADKACDVVTFGWWIPAGKGREAEEAWVMQGVSRGVSSPDDHCWLIVRVKRATSATPPV